MVGYRTIMSDLSSKRARKHESQEIATQHAFFTTSYTSTWRPSHEGRDCRGERHRGMSRFYALGVLVLACAAERQPNVTDEETEQAHRNLRTGGRDAVYKGHSPVTNAGVRHAINTIESDHHDRYEFHAEAVLAHADTHDEVRIYRTNKHPTDKGSAFSLHMLPSCGIVDGWFLSINDSPFWKVKAHPVTNPIVAQCKYTFVDATHWPRGRLPKQTGGDTKVVFVREQPAVDPAFKWKDEL